MVKPGAGWARSKELSRLRRETRWDAGGQQLFERSYNAYQHALELLPNDQLWHAGFAELLYRHYYWTEINAPSKPGLLQALEELLPRLCWRSMSLLCATWWRK